MIINLTIKYGVAVIFLHFLVQIHSQNEGLENVESKDEKGDDKAIKSALEFLSMVSGDEFLLQLIQGFTSNLTDQSTIDGKLFAGILKSLNVSESCGVDIYTMTNDYYAEKEYAKRMVTAAGTPPDASSEFTWNTVSLGIYEQCVLVKEGSFGAPFDAKYCLLEIFPSGTKIKLAECVPSSCSTDDLNIIVYAIMHSASQLPKNTFLYHHCEGKVSWDGDAIFTMFLCSVFLLGVFIATGYDAYRSCEHKRQTETGEVRIKLEECEGTEEEASSLNAENKNVDELADDDDGATRKENKDSKQEEPTTKKRKTKRCFVDELVRAFSLMHNAPKVLETEARPGTFPVLNGIRVLSMFWIILAHTIQFMSYNLDNVLHVLITYMSEFYFVTVWNATYAVDTFFLLSGLLLCYLTLKTLKKSEGKLNWGLFYFHRWWRISSVYYIALAIYSSLIIHVANGPGSNQIFGGMRQVCRERWWINVLYLNNLIPFPGDLIDVCMGWSWYLAVDMQFFIFTPPILYLLYKRPRIGIGLIASMCIVSFAITAGLTSYWGLKAGLNEGFYNNRSLDYPNADRIYTKPYARVSTYLVGLLVGYIMYMYDGRKLEIPKIGLAVGWSISIILGMSVIFGVYQTYDTEISQTAAVFYHTLSRFSFALAIAWVVLVCVFGYGGPVNAFLSFGIWAPLARLTFGAYLIHPVILFLYVFTSNRLFHYENSIIIYAFVATIILSYAASFALSMFVEGPTMGLEKIMVYRGKKRN